MKHLLVRGSAAVLVAAAALSAACSNDPTAPQAPIAARTPSATAAAPSHYVGSATIGDQVGGRVGPGDEGGASTNSGYLVSWSKNGKPTPGPAE